MVNLYSSKYKVYYIHDYIPERKRIEYDYTSVNMSEKLIDYKNGEDEAMEFFTNEIMEAIAYLSNNVMENYVENLALVPIPPSKVNKYSPIKQSIYQIRRWFDEGIIESKYNCKKNIFNYSNLLKRTSDVNTAHKEYPRPTFQEHLDSIQCSKNNLSRDYMTFILLDDITTTGITMNACKSILLNHGANKRFIYRLAIGGTGE